MSLFEGSVHWVPQGVSRKQSNEFEQLIQIHLTVKALAVRLYYQIPNSHLSKFNTKWGVLIGQSLNLHVKYYTSVGYCTSENTTLVKKTMKVTGFEPTTIGFIWLAFTTKPYSYFQWNYVKFIYWSFSFFSQIIL